MGRPRVPQGLGSRCGAARARVPVRALGPADSRGLPRDRDLRGARRSGRRRRGADAARAGAGANARRARLDLGDHLVRRCEEHRALRQRGAEGAVPAADGARRDPLRDRLHRGGRGHGRARRDDHAGPQRRRRLDRRGRQDLVLLRARGRLHPPARPHRRERREAPPRPESLSRSDCRGGRADHGAAEARDARHRLVRRRPRRRLRARRARARGAGECVADAAADAEQRAHHRLRLLLRDPRRSPRRRARVRRRSARRSGARSASSRSSSTTSPTSRCGATRPAS